MSLDDTDRYRMSDPLSEQGLKMSRRKNTLVISLVSLVAIVLLVVSVGLPIYEDMRDPDIAAYADTPISLVGLDFEGQTLETTARELSEMECVSISADGQGKGPNGQSKAGRVKAFGPSLETFLESYGCVPSDFRRIIFNAKDGYNVILYGEMLDDEVIMSIASSKDALYEDQQPMRLVIPDQQAGNWTYGINEIIFER